ncbi:hypothetical protein [Nocardiopsis sp. EMB25]|nr:hypothetical protein [Nocardiopsis sp. EMB25]
MSEYGDEVRYRVDGQCEVAGQQPRLARPGPGEGGDGERPEQE